MLALPWLEASPAQAADPCAAPANVVVAENCKPGSDKDVWDVDGSGDPSIQGFATDVSVTAADVVRFKVKTNARDYRLDIYRMGYYGGMGARLVAIVQPSASLPQVQPNCVTEVSTGLVDCGNWSVSASWAVPESAVSGMYFAKLIRSDTGGASHIPFVVRDDTRRSDLLFQTSDTTWQAYNDYGGNSLYSGAPAGRAYKVSYNRPIVTRGNQYRRASFFNAEYPMIRWMEANGYDVSYTTGVDSDRRGGELLEHEVFLSVGHDEYWSTGQRANVEAARDSGVHLAFFSGNEVFWKTRWEKSIDGSGTSHRTLVTYKETTADAKIDPESSIWTGTWRDPRFSPPADGGRPENALTGTIFTVNCCQFDPITVSESEGKLRFWRNTSFAALAPGTSAKTVDGIVGYEWDEDLDNGFRPPGLFRMSSTTVNVPSRLTNHGNRYAPGTATHSVTLYRHDSGALVFGAGTIQWSWGLDSNHDNQNGVPLSTDRNVQQATVNLLADMNAQPGSLQGGLVRSTTSTDTTKPSSTVTAPSPNSTAAVGAPVTVSGTASDGGGGRVGGVEVSTDAGSTWHRADGRASWTYTWIPDKVGTFTIRSRAVDDSGNLEAPSPGVSVAVVPSSCPCSIWSDAAVPAVASANDSAAVELGLKFRADQAGSITGVRFYKGAGNTGTHVGSLWTTSGTRLASATFSGESASGWQNVNFATPVSVSAGTTYVVSYHAPKGNYAVTGGQFATAGVDNAPLHALASGVDGLNGVFKYGASGTFPTDSFNSANYWVDVVFSTDTTSPPPDTTPPQITAVQSASVTSSGVTLTWATDEAADSQVNFGTSTAYGSSTALDQSAVRSHSVTLSGLSSGTQYHYRVKSRDAAGNLATSADATFTTKTVGSCPCSIWSDAAVPAVASANDSAAVELGLKFRADQAGSITGVRFYKGAGNTGTHVGSLWTTSGTRLASATFSGESASGWQNVNFATPVSVSAGTTYVVSYHAPKGNYAVTGGQFATAGVDNAPLHALASGVDGLNGVFKYGASGTFPTDSFNSANYWVDVVFSTDTTSPPPDTTPPQITAVQSASVTSSGVTLTWATDEAADSQVNFGTSTAYGSSTALDQSAVRSHSVTLSGLSSGTQYHYRVKSRDAAGNLATSADATFTTKTVGSCPCSIWSDAAVPAVASANDSAAVELGLKFRADQAGSITGVRFYKGAGNTGTHVGSLWTTSGTRLASATFSGESASGWQNVNFATPVSVSAGTTYVVSYHAPKGNYAVTGGQFATAGVDNAPLHALASGVDGLNGVFKYGASGTFPTDSFNSANYWVDVVFSTDTTSPPPDTTPPQITAVQSASVTSSGVTLTWATDEAADSQVNFGTSTAYGSSTALDQSAVRSHSVTLSGLSSGTQYHYRVKSRDAAGNLATSADATFTTKTVGSCPCSIWSDAAVPAVASANDSAAVELGLKFRADQAGSITGVRFYKGAGNTGTHVGSLWTTSGTRLASATFSGESASGWQNVNFATPVSVSAGTTYVVSYHAPKGNYAVTGGQFATAGVDNAPLHALASGVDGLNGVFKYGASGTFPTDSFNSANYWVDVVFRPGQ